MEPGVIAAEITPLPNRAREAAKALQDIGFRILHLGPTISVTGPRELWQSVFRVDFEPRAKPAIAGIEEPEARYLKALTENLRLPPEVQNLIEDISFAEPPEFY